MKHIDEKIGEIETKLKSPELDLPDQDLPNDIYLDKCIKIFREKWKLKQELALLKSELIV